MYKRSGAVLSILISGVTAALTGCGMGTIDHTNIGDPSSLSGTVFGGQQPVVGATIQLYTVGSAGNASAATPMIGSLVQTDNAGNFKITSDYNCGKSSLGATITGGSGQVYIVATEGNPGLDPPANNAAIVLIAALGPCSGLSSTQFIEINEVTTVAAAWALAPFMTSYTHVGASSTNTAGITNAFLDAGLLADTSTGLAATLPSNLKVETNKLYALANSIASCVNSDGGTGCAPLFTAATPMVGSPSALATPPTNTLSAALNIVKYPGQNVTAVYEAAGKTPPFPTGYTKAPNDWTMSLTIKGGGLDQPTSLALDAEGNVWTAGYSGPVSAFNAQGTPLSATGFAAGYLDHAFAIAVDSNGDIWVADYNATYNDPGAAIKVLGANSSAEGPVGTVVTNGSNHGFTTDIWYPFGVSADTNGHVFFNSDGKGATALNSDGSLYEGYLGGTSIPAIPESIAVDAFGGYWIPDGDSSIIHVAADGSSVATVCCENSNGVATDASHNVWIADYFGESFSEVANDGSLVMNPDSPGGGLEFPRFVAVDAGQNVWFSNLIGSISEIAGNEGSLPAGTAISPTVGTGSGTAGGYGLDAKLDEPNSIVPDRSGNLWTSNEFGESVTMFFGLATPTVTPIQTVPTAP